MPSQSRLVTDPRRPPATVAPFKVLIGSVQWSGALVSCAVIQGPGCQIAWPAVGPDLRMKLLVAALLLTLGVMGQDNQWHHQADYYDGEEVAEWSEEVELEPTGNTPVLNQEQITVDEYLNYDDGTEIDGQPLENEVDYFSYNDDNYENLFPKELYIGNADNENVEENINKDKYVGKEDENNRFGMYQSGFQDKSRPMAQESPEKEKFDFGILSQNNPSFHDFFSTTESANVMTAMFSQKQKTTSRPKYFTKSPKLDNQKEFNKFTRVLESFNIPHSVQGVKPKGKLHLPKKLSLFLTVLTEFTTSYNKVSNVLLKQ